MTSTPDTATARRRLNGTIAGYVVATRRAHLGDAPPRSENGTVYPTALRRTGVPLAPGEDVAALLVLDEQPEP